jgi:hypothetical protein
MGVLSGFALSVEQKEVAPDYWERIKVGVLGPWIGGLVFHLILA